MHAGFGGSLLAEQPGGLPASMANLEAVWIEDDGATGAYAAGTVFPPGLPILLAARISGLRGTRIRFTIETAGGVIVLGPVEIGVVADLFSPSEVGKLSTNAPPVDGNYVVRAVDMVPFLPDTEKTTTFSVLATAPIPGLGTIPVPGTGGGGVGSLFDSLKALAIPAAIVVGLLVLAPTINRAGRRFIGD